MQVLILCAPDYAAGQLDLGPWEERVTRLAVDASNVPAALGKSLPDVLLLCYPAHQLAPLADQARHVVPRAVTAIIGEDPTQDQLINYLRMGIADVLQETDPNGIIAFLERAEQRLKSRLGADRVAAKKLGFIAGKGGSGATFALANFASVLAEQCDGRVLLVDLSFPFGDLDLYLDPETAHNDLLDLVEAVGRIDQPLLRALVREVAPKLDLVTSPIHPERIVRLESEAVARLLEAVEHYYEFILVDLGQAIDHIGARIIDTFDRLFVIGRTDLASARRTGQLLRLIADMELPRTGIAVAAVDWGKGGVAVTEFEKAAGQAAEVILPDAGVEAGVSLARGRTLAQVAPNSKYARAIKAWVSELTGRKAERSSLWSIFATR